MMSAVKPYPLQFIPVMQHYLWGGWKLRELYGKGSGTGPWAESWEVVDHAKAQSIVRHGSLQGWSLQQVMAAWGPQLVGHRVWEEILRPGLPESLRGRFPLLLKFLDARLDLSVQVHPNDRQAALLNPPDLGKSEAWVVLQADPGARIYAGTKPNVGRKEFLAALATGCVADCLHSFEPTIGDSVYIPAGTPHAIGAGLVIAEIQQASDTTYRVFDWNRVDAAGSPRPLHIEQALDVIDFQRGPVQPLPATKVDATRVHVLNTPFFSISRLIGPLQMEFESDDSFRIVAVVRGRTTWFESGREIVMGAGDTLLIPAQCSSGALHLDEKSEFLEFTTGQTQ